MPETSSDVTQLLRRWGQGDHEALERLIPLVFTELREIAGRLFRRENEAHTLQPTALVSEVYLRLTKQRAHEWQNREQFFSVAALLMRRILVDYAKGRGTGKRGGGAVNLSLEEAVEVAELPRGVDLVNLDEALSRLGEIDPRQARVVELRFFVGLSNEEVSELLGTSVTTVKREWRTAKLWLVRELSTA